MGISIVVTSGKGGVGKSTVSTGIGRALAEKGRRVLLVDCDAGLRSLDRLTGIEQGVVFDISDVIHGRCAPIDAIYPVDKSERLFVMPAALSPQGVVSPDIMEKFITMLKKYYDYVILDSPAGIGGGFVSAACAAQRAIVVCNPDPVCVRSSAVVRERLQELGIEEMGLVINRFNDDFFDTVAAYEDLDRVIDDTGIRLLGVIPEDFSLAASFLRGRAAQSSLNGAMAISRITGRLEGEMIPIIM